MKIETKSAPILAATLALGIVLGMNEGIICTAHEALRTELDSMRLRLGSVLTDAQKQRLERLEPLPDPFRPPPR